MKNRYNQHGLKGKDGHELTALESAERKEKAKFMYLKERLSLRRIAAQLHVSAQTVSNWKKSQGWDLVAARAEKAKEKALLKDLTGAVKISQLVDKEYVIEGLRKIAENGVTESNRVAAFKALGESLGMFDGKKAGAVEAPLIIQPPEAPAEGAGSDKVDAPPTAPVAPPEPGVVVEPPSEGTNGTEGIQTSPPSMGSS